MTTQMFQDISSKWIRAFHNKAGYFYEDSKYSTQEKTILNNSNITLLRKPVKNLFGKRISIYVSWSSN